VTKKISGGTRREADFDIQSYIPYLMRFATESMYERMSVNLRPFDLTVPMWRLMAVLNHRHEMRFHTLAQLGKFIQEFGAIQIVAKRLTQQLK